MKDLADEVKQDIENRIQKGVQTYGERLKPNNGRIALQDAYEEILDLALYIKQELLEKKEIIKIIDYLIIRDEQMAEVFDNDDNWDKGKFGQYSSKVKTVLTELKQKIGE